MQFRRCLLIFAGLVLFNVAGFSQDQKFYIFLCFGQSNMEGNARFEPQDTTVDNRFQLLQAVDCSNLKRTRDNWYTAAPPITRCGTGLTPADYFGRTLLASLPKDVKVGVINVAVGGCKIELFMRDSLKGYTATAPGWMANMIKEYNGDPYTRLVELGKLAKQKGVIKGILLHQGESNTGDKNWPMKVKSVYDNLLKDLDLKNNSVPLLAGEMVGADQGGRCASMNTIIATLPQQIPNSYVISSAGCTSAADKLHFDAAGYRELGRRYGVQMLALLEPKKK